jgi:hypothetical protein
MTGMPIGTHLLSYFTLSEKGDKKRHHKRNKHHPECQGKEHLNRWVERKLS